MPRSSSSICSAGGALSGAGSTFIGRTVSRTWSSSTSRTSGIEAAGDRRLVGSHPVYHYLARRYGLEIESVHFEPDAVDRAVRRDFGGRHPGAVDVGVEIVAGADVVVSPFDIGARRMAHAILRPNVIRFLEFAFTDESTDIHIEELPVSASSKLNNVTLQESGIRQNHNLIILSIIKKDGEIHLCKENVCDLSIIVFYYSLYIHK